MSDSKKLRLMAMQKKKSKNWLIKQVVFAVIPLGFFLLCALMLLMVMVMPSPNINQDILPMYKTYADLMGADWQLLAAYDLAVHNNQADALDPEAAAWFFLTVEFDGKILNGKNRIQDYFGEPLSFEEAMTRFIQMNQSAESEIYEVGAKDIVSLENKLSDEEFKWVEALISNNVISQMAGEASYQGVSYQKLVLESKGYFALPLSSGSYTVSARGFGYRMHPIKKVMKFHSGQDFGSSSGTPVGASADGVANVRWDPDGYGKYIVVTHPNGMSTLYAHLSATLVMKGQEVKKGEVIGLVGSTGGSTGPHLHFEIRKNSQYFDPMKFLK